MHKAYRHNVHTQISFARLKSVRRFCTLSLCIFSPFITARKRSCGKVMFTEACVILLTEGGHAWLGGMSGWGRGHVWLGACMTRGHVWWGACAWLGVCMAGGHARLGVCTAWEHAWLGACITRGMCMAGSVHDWGSCKVGVHDWGHAWLGRNVWLGHA